MKDLKHKGYTYTVYIRPWLKGDKKYEVIKYPNGYRNFWERVPYSEYLEILNLKNKKGELNKSTPKIIKIIKIT
jgi:hypothetical protein